MVTGILNEMRVTLYEAAPVPVNFSSELGFFNDLIADTRNKLGHPGLHCQRYALL
jgi:hypothetical protein